MNIQNLSVLHLDILNTGNKDYAEFPFGVTLSTGDFLAHCDTTTPDRHHQVGILQEFGPGAPVDKLDFKLTPFNRNDAYRLTLFLVASVGKEPSGQIALSSVEPIVFRNSQASTDAALKILRLAIQAGVFKL